MIAVSLRTSRELLLAYAYMRKVASKGLDVCSSIWHLGRRANTSTSAWSESLQSDLSTGSANY